VTKVLTLTNTYAPHVGGVARSVKCLAEELRRQGNSVLVVAPTFAERSDELDLDVLRFPSLQDVNGSSFSIPMPVPGRLRAAVRAFRPDVVHSHHPFLLGDTALRIGAQYALPVVFTHHTRYEHYTHYVPGDSSALKAFVIELVTGYCNLCDAVVAPSETVARILRARGVEAPISVIPTGVELTVLSGGNRARFRAALGIPEDDFVVGHVGRLAPEKNLELLGEAIAGFLAEQPRARFVLVGDGPSRSSLRAQLERLEVAHRVHDVGLLEHPGIADAYAVMDVFAFASLSETQGLVLVEAMAAGVPVVALDGPGVREVVRDGKNGRLLSSPSGQALHDALCWVRELSEERRDELRRGALETGRSFSLASCTARMLALYQELVHAGRRPHPAAPSAWRAARRRFTEDWRIARNMVRAAAIRTPPAGRSALAGERSLAT
jgi:glycosyltransferase involved in cell wall biosynthesis